VRRLLFLVLVSSACSTSAPESEQVGLLPADFRVRGFVVARDCRHPGEHSGLGGFRVWVNDDARAALDQLWAGHIDTMPNGAVVAKETFNGTDCRERDLAAIVTMRKVDGAAPADGDWLWEDRDAAGRKANTASNRACIGCHRGKASCSGYGVDGAKDYLCTEP